MVPNVQYKVTCFYSCPISKKKVRMTAVVCLSSKYNLLGFCSKTYRRFVIMDMINPDSSNNFTNPGEEI